MSRRDEYPHGVPCWVDTLVDDLDAATRFYAGVFGWELSGPGPMAGGQPGGYYVARLDDDDVAGIGSTVTSAPAGPAWNTYVAVASVDAAAADAQAAGGSVIQEPFDAPPAGRMAVVADPAGATLCLWQGGARPGAARVNEPSAWAMSLLSTEDPDGAHRFYGELFGWQAEEFAPGLWLWRLPGYVGGEPQQPVPRDVVAAMAATDERAPGWEVDFWIADADGAAAAASELGGRVVAEPTEDGGFRRAVLAGPDGAEFSVSQLQYVAG
jgi:predicted enzyme related to lactoylglutathione lyase